MSTIINTCDDPIFVAEQEHLSKVHAQLHDIEAQALRKLEETAAAAAADKDSMTEDIAHNFSSDDEAMETYAAIAAVNRIIEGYNISQEVNTQRLNDARLLLKQPYFAKIALQFKPGEEPKDLYIGNAGMSDEARRRLVVDWRSPVAEVYYNNQESGTVSYQANGRTISAELKLRRQFNIEEDRLNAYFDTNVAIQDALLLASLSKQRTAQMQAITSTIQKEQNVIVRHEDVPTLIVNGIAGSGKTSVLLQRIAYLFYQQRDTLRPDHIFLITPNPVFGRYIDNVLPDMGEKNPHILTWDQLTAGLMPSGRGGSMNIDLSELSTIDTGIPRLELEQNDFKDVKCNEVRFLSTGQIMQVLGKYKNVPMGPHRITLMREELLKRVRSRIAQMAGTERSQDELADLSTEEQLELFREVIAPQSEVEWKQYTLQYLNHKFADALRAVENDDWLRIDRIGMRLLNANNLTPVTWLYTKIALTGLGNPEAKYVMIDEVQDYTAAQLAVLARYFSRAHFLLLGDRRQAIKPETIPFDEIRTVFEKQHGPVSTCNLLTSYRSSPEITDLFASLLPQEERMSISSVQAEQGAPRIALVHSEEERLDAIRAILKRVEGESGLTAIVTPDGNQARMLHAALGNDAPAVLGNDESLPSAGAIILPLKLAKGLEFDRVIIPNASDRVFGTDWLSRNQLYTTVSRATHGLDIVSFDPITKLLQNDTE